MEVQARWHDQGMNATIAELQRRPRNPLPALWDKNDFAARQAWEKILRLTPNDKATMAELAKRQSALAGASPHLLALDAVATAPFTTGLGNEHPLENGFAFLSPYGLPYLPGSGVKGVVRQAARELASGEWGDTQGWSNAPIHLLQRKGRADIELTMLDVLFGRETEDGSGPHVRGALSFWDALPQIPGDSLAVDIMTPHQSHYYQQKVDRKSGDSASPHDSGQPTPISFLTLPPGTRFAFHVQCDLAHLQRLAPDLAENHRWQTRRQQPSSTPLHGWASVPRRRWATGPCNRKRSANVSSASSKSAPPKSRPRKKPRRWSASRPTPSCGRGHVPNSTARQNLP